MSQMIKDCLLYFLIVLFSLTFNISHSQSIKGYVYNGENSKPIPYASVYIIGRPTGTISNEKGYFEISSVNKNDTVEISSINFTSKRVFANDIKDSIFLDPNYNNLPDISIKAINPTEILSVSLNKSNSLLNRNIAFDGYYREYLKINDSIKKFSDGLINLYIPEKKDKYLFEVKESRAAENYSENDSKAIENLMTGLTINSIVRNYFPNNISEAFTKEQEINYNYSLNSNDDNIIVHIIPLKDKMEEQPKNIRNDLSSIDVFINKSDTTLSSIEINLLPKAKGLTIGKSLFAHGDIYDYKLVANFRKIDKKIYLSHISGDIVYRSINSIQNVNLKIECKSELIITNLKDSITEKDFPRRNLYKNDFLFENDNKYKTSFWTGNNTIIGTPEETEFMKRIENK